MLTRARCSQLCFSPYLSAQATRGHAHQLQFGSYYSSHAHSYESSIMYCKDCKEWCTHSGLISEALGCTLLLRTDPASAIGSLSHWSTAHPAFHRYMAAQANHDGLQKRRPCLTHVCLIKVVLIFSSTFWFSCCRGISWLSDALGPSSACSWQRQQHQKRRHNSNGRAKGRQPECRAFRRNLWAAWCGDAAGRVYTRHHRLLPLLAGV
jgi:hypothetical protein